MVRAQVGSAAWAVAVATAIATGAFAVVALTTTGVARAEIRVMATRVAVRVMTGSPGRAQSRLHGRDLKDRRRAAVRSRTRERMGQLPVRDPALSGEPFWAATAAELDADTHAMIWLD